MGFVMLRKDDLACKVEFLQDSVSHPELLLDPERHGREKRSKPHGGKGQVGLEQSFEFQEGLFIESHVVEILRADIPLAKAEGHGTGWEGRVVLLARESLFLGRRNDLAVADQASGTVVIKSGYPENIDRLHPLPEFYDVFWVFYRTSTNYASPEAIADRIRTVM